MGGGGKGIKKKKNGKSRIGVGKRRGNRKEKKEGIGERPSTRC